VYTGTDSTLVYKLMDELRVRGHVHPVPGL
jgi:hypothetical protein